MSDVVHFAYGRIRPWMSQHPGYFRDIDTLATIASFDMPLGRHSVNGHHCDEFTVKNRRQVALQLKLVRIIEKRYFRAVRSDR